METGVQGLGGQGRGGQYGWGAWGRAMGGREGGRQGGKIRVLLSIFWFLPSGEALIGFRVLKEQGLSVFCPG